MLCHLQDNLPLRLPSSEDPFPVGWPIDRPVLNKGEAITKVQNTKARDLLVSFGRPSSPFRL